MEEQTSSADNYLLGHTPQAIQRLLLLGQIYHPFTRRMFAEAGVTTGMKILDVGCGPGDVSLIAADLVGETGSVLGIDASADMLQVAQTRVQAAGLKHISFLQADLRTLALDQQFDALVGRFILMHLPEPEAVLRQLVHSVRPGGIVAFQEYDLSSHADASYPPSPLWEQALRLSTVPFERAGGNLRAGMQLPAMFRAAGLPTPHMSYEASIGADRDWAGFEMRAEDVRMFLPLIEQFGLATEEEIGIDTLADRLREETVGRGGVARLPIVVSAWVRKPVG
ncbi:MAG TPA: class I SAM-dependent methyltransferase [Ktedonobacterales bacterium]|nr:class I SAM-dependent methyltransferase [Ktedonobacterales bacterium]